jgi:hypothetical protein
LDDILCINCEKPMKGDDKKWFCDCGTTVWKVNSGKLLSPMHLKQLMDQGQTEVLMSSKKHWIHGFRWLHLVNLMQPE